MSSPTLEPARKRRAPLPSGPRIAALTLADSAQSFSQEQVLERLNLKGEEFAERIFARCGVRRRHLNLTDTFLERTLQGRTSEVEDELMVRSIEAVEGLGVDPAKIGTVLSASLYSLGCPSLAHRLVDHFQMDPATDKYHLTGVGCASAVPLMRLGSQALSQQPDKHTLIVAAESMSALLVRADAQDARAKTVSSAIFGDGCAAALLCSESGASGPMILSSQVYQLDNTLGAVSMAPQEGYLHLARELPDLAGAGLGGLVEEFLAANSLSRAGVEHWIVHPGGRRIIESIQAALDLCDEDVAVSWDALANHGNVGTPAIFYVLADTISQRRPQPGERALMVTIGPGVTVGLMLLQF